MIVSLKNLFTCYTSYTGWDTKEQNRLHSTRFHTLAKRTNIQRKSNANPTPPLKCTLTFIEHRLKGMRVYMRHTTGANSCT